MSKRMIVLVMAMIAVVAASTAAAQAKKLNVVQCPTGGGSYECVGTTANDLLIGRDNADDYIKGGKGDDTYDGKGGGDSWEDGDLKSRDTYLVSVENFNSIGIDLLTIQDNGGKSDTLDLSRFYASSDFLLSKAYIHLNMDGPGNNDIVVYNFFTTNSLESIEFSDKTLTAKQIKNMGL